MDSRTRGEGGFKSKFGAEFVFALALSHWALTFLPDHVEAIVPEVRQIVSQALTGEAT